MASAVDGVESAFGSRVAAPFVLDGPGVKVKDLIRRSEWRPGEGYGRGKPKVSVLLPTFRRGASGLFLESARSVLAQTMEEIELIIIDDASTDSTAEQIRRLMAEDGRVSCLRHPLNIGLPAISEYEGLLKARADVLAFAFDDDEFLPTAIQGLWESMTAGGHAFVYGHVDMFVNDDATGKRRTLAAFGHGDSPQGELASRNFISNNAVMLRRDVIETVGFYDPHVAISRLCDWDLWRRAGKQFELAAVDVKVGFVRGPTTSDSLGHTRAMELWQSMEWMSLRRNETLRPGPIEEYDVLAVPDGVSRETRLAIEELEEDFKDKWWCPQPRTPSAEASAVPDGHLLVVAAVHNASTTLYFESLPASWQPRVRIVHAAHHLPCEMIGASAVVFVRDLFELTDWAVYARQLGVPAYYFLDDNFMILREESKRFFRYTEARVREALRSFSGVLLSTHALIDYFREHQLHDNLIYYPPVAQFDAAELPRPDRHSRKTLKIAFFGGAHRIQPFQEVVVPAICDLAKRRPVELAVMGIARDRLPSVPNLRVECHPFEISYDLALGRMIEFRPDVLVHPHGPTANALFKTANILINARMLDAVPIVGDEPPYSGLRGENVALLCDSTRESWIAAIESAVDDQDARRRMRENLEAYCLAHFSGEPNTEAVRRIFETHRSPGLVLRDMRWRKAFAIGPPPILPRVYRRIRDRISRLRRSGRKGLWNLVRSASSRSWNHFRARIGF